MGCFDLTCAISRTSIRVGDPVFVLYTNMSHASTTYNMMQSLSLGLERRLAEHDYTYQYAESHNKMVESGLGAKDDELIDLVAMKAKLDEKPRGWDKGYIRFRFGTYNDYGGIEEEEIPDNAYKTMIHRDVFDKLIAMHQMSWIHDTSRLADWDSKQILLLKLGSVCYRARLELFPGEEPLGGQHRDLAEMQVIRKVGRAVNSWQRKLYRHVLWNHVKYKVQDYIWHKKYNFKKWNKERKKKNDSDS